MIFIVVIICIFVIDQLFKKKIDTTMDFQGSKPILNNNIIINKAYNEGAFLGFLKKRKKVLSIINIISVLCITILFIKALFGYGNTLLRWALSLILGGAISNLYDRLKYNHVIDYFSFKRLKKVVFNLGDMFIFIGAALMLIYAVIYEKR